jgi:hypothetical protein
MGVGIQSRSITENEIIGVTTNQQMASGNDSGDQMNNAESQSTFNFDQVNLPPLVPGTSAIALASRSTMVQIDQINAL